MRQTPGLARDLARQLPGRGQDDGSTATAARAVGGGNGLLSSTLGQKPCQERNGKGPCRTETVQTIEQKLQVRPINPS
eukprot:SAG31_NODE_1745_length_7379_cov_8.772115_2_plen_78_part_00